MPSSSARWMVSIPACSSPGPYACDIPMQPSPSADTSSPRVPSLRLSIEFLLVDRDLSFDERQMPAHLAELLQDFGPMLAEQRQALGLVAIAGANQLRVPLHVPDRHPRRAETL